MAENITDRIKSYYLCVPRSQRNHLAQIWHWDHLKVAIHKDDIWITNFIDQQIDDALVLTLPQKKRFYTHNGLLFPVGSILPERQLPKGLLWTPITKAFPLTYPDLNHNFFGIADTINPKLVPSNKEQKPCALLTSITEAKAYIEKAPNFRLHNLKWVLLNDDQVFLFGTPLLPINGKTFWITNNFLLPTGYEFNFPILTNTLQQSINPFQTKFILWNTDQTYVTLSKNLFQQLSISSFRLTVSGHKL